MLEATDCCLCAQIQGRASNDLIAALLPGRPYERRVMYESGVFAVVPSLGPLTPGHSLLCPKKHVRSFAELSPRLNAEFVRVKSALRAHLAALYGWEVHLFEHGAARVDARTLCTVDHAHMHFVPLPSAVADVAPEGPWAPCGESIGELRAHSGGREYVYYESASRAGRMRACDAEIESQYMRKVIARCLGQPDSWDWRTDPKASAADEAWRRFAA
jgi:diadenosine tetraphosphate (Ap4A) HIT family hydrolase